MDHKKIFIVTSFLAFLGSLYFIKRKYSSQESHKNNNMMKIIEYRENEARDGQKDSIDENIRIGSGEGTFGFGRFGSSFMA